MKKYPFRLPPDVQCFEIPGLTKTWEDVMAAEEELIREMLGQWVSECEPALVYDENFRLVGLTNAAIPVGVKAPIAVRVRE